MKLSAAAIAALAGLTIVCITILAAVGATTPETLDRALTTLIGGIIGGATGSGLTLAARNIDTTALRRLWRD